MKIRSAAITLVLLATGCLAQTPSQPSPGAFIRTLIKAEAADSRAEEDAQAGRRGAERIYTPSLVALIRADRRRAGGEVGNLDYDPICFCQDTDGLALEELKIASTSTKTADALATLSFHGSQKQEVTYHLVLTTSGWRIDDISTTEVLSLRKLLQ